jgi:integrin beta 3
MTEELDADGRTLVRRYSRGDKVKEVRHTFAVVLDRGVWEEGRTYVKGDSVTYQGQLYIAQDETAAMPHTPAAKDNWRLAVKSGRNGKDGVVRTVNSKPIVKVG